MERIHLTTKQLWRLRVNRWMCKLIGHEEGNEAWSGDSDSDKKVHATCRWCYKQLVLFKVKHKYH